MTEIEINESEIPQQKMTGLQKLFYIQQRLSVKKSREMKMGSSKYSYRNAEDIIAALKPILAFTNTSLIFDSNLEKKEEYWMFTCTGILIDTESGDEILKEKFTLPVSFGRMSNEQATGAAASYAKKYVLGNMFLMDDEDESSLVDTGRTPAKKETALNQMEQNANNMEKDAMTDKQREAFEKNKSKIREKIQKEGYSESEFVNALFHKTSLNGLSPNQIKTTVERFDDALKKFKENVNQVPF